MVSYELSCIQRFPELGLWERRWGSTQDPSSGWPHEPHPGGNRRRDPLTDLTENSVCSEEWSSLGLCLLLPAHSSPTLGGTQSHPWHTNACSYVSYFLRTLKFALKSILYITIRDSVYFVHHFTQVPPTMPTTLWGCIEWIRENMGCHIRILIFYILFVFFNAMISMKDLFVWGGYWYIWSCILFTKATYKD